MWARIRIGIEMAGAVISLSGMVHDLLMAGAVSPLMACLFVSFIVSLVWEFTGSRPLVRSRREGIIGFFLLFLLTLAASLWYNIRSRAGLP